MCWGRQFLNYSSKKVFRKISVDARSSNVLHDTSTIANTPGAYPLLISFNKLTETTTTIKTIKNQSEVSDNVYLICVVVYIE